jgi:D-alanyl-D-alanine carboxypeptidase
MLRAQSGSLHILIPLLVAIFVACIGTFMYVRSSAGTSSPYSKNPWTVKCSGNRVLYGTPKGSTATATARKRVFGPPYPRANVELTTFMGKNVYVNKKITPCLKAVEWDLTNNATYRSSYRLQSIYGASEVNAQNPTHYFHAYGGAVDINPSQNPQCLNSCAQDMPKQWVRAFQAHGFYWGGKFPVHKDYMHFEWHGER